MMRTPTPKWTEYKPIARERGAFAFELYAVEITSIADEAALKSTLPEHSVYQKHLEGTGARFLAGPLSNDTGELMQGSGLIIYRCASLREQ